MAGNTASSDEPTHLANSSSIGTQEEIDVKNEVNKAYGSSFPINKIVLLLSAYVFLVSFKIIELTAEESGGDSYLYPIICVLLALSMLGFVYLARRIISKETTGKIALGYQFSLSDIPWNSRHYLYMPLAGLITGIFSAMLGIGGGLVLAPVLLEFNLHPSVSSATCNFIVLFTSSSTTLQFSFYVWS